MRSKCSAVPTIKHAVLGDCFTVSVVVILI